MNHSKLLVGIVPNDYYIKNSTFEKYEGASVSGSEVKSLIRLVSAYNTDEIFPQPINLTINTSLKNYNEVGTTL